MLDARCGREDFRFWIADFGFSMLYKRCGIQDALEFEVGNIVMFIFIVQRMLDDPIVAPDAKSRVPNYAT